jgi:chemotaxis protein CheD
MIKNPLPILSEKIYLKQGEIFASSRPVQIVTILGSCVGIIFYDRISGLGAMAHAMYPRFAAHTEKRSFSKPYYVDTAIELMYSLFIKRGIKHKNIKTYVFGGGNVLLSKEQAHYKIGSDNFSVALSTLQELELHASDAINGCASGQRLVLNLATHEILLYALDSNFKESLNG